MEGSVYTEVVPADQPESAIPAGTTFAMCLFYAEVVPADQQESAIPAGNSFAMHLLYAEVYRLTSLNQQYRPVPLLRKVYVTQKWYRSTSLNNKTGRYHVCNISILRRSGTGRPT